MYFKYGNIIWFKNHNVIEGSFFYIISCQGKFNNLLDYLKEKEQLKRILLIVEKSTFFPTSYNEQKK